MFVPETWSPKEIALFTHCICRFEKEFDVFVNYVSLLREPWALTRSACPAVKIKTDTILFVD